MEDWVKWVKGCGRHGLPSGEGFMKQKGQLEEKVACNGMDGTYPGAGHLDLVHPWVVDLKLNTVTDKKRYAVRT